MVQSKNFSKFLAIAFVCQIMLTIGLFHQTYLADWTNGVPASDPAISQADHSVASRDACVATSPRPC